MTTPAAEEPRGLAPPQEKSGWAEWKSDLKWAVSLLLLTILALSGAYNAAWQVTPEGREDLGVLTTGGLLAPHPVPVADGVGAISSEEASEALRAGRPVVIVNGEAHADDALAAAVRQGQPVFIANGTATADADRAARAQRGEPLPSGVVRAESARIVTPAQVTFEMPLVFLLELLAVLLVAALVGALMLAMRDPPDAEEVA